MPRVSFIPALGRGDWRVPGSRYSASLDESSELQVSGRDPVFDFVFKDVEQQRKLQCADLWSPQIHVTCTCIPCVMGRAYWWLKMWILFSCCCCCCYFENGLCCVVLRGLELTMKTRIAWNSQRSFCHCLPSSRATTSSSSYVYFKQNTEFQALFTSLDGLIQGEWHTGDMSPGCSVAS